jgi:hypothetical protein
MRRHRILSMAIEREWLKPAVDGEGERGIVDAWWGWSSS